MGFISRCEVFLSGISWDAVSALLSLAISAAIKNEKIEFVFYYCRRSKVEHKKLRMAKNVKNLD